MATFSPCFAGEQTQKKPICTTNAECWHGMCVCKHGNSSFTIIHHPRAINHNSLIWQRWKKKEKKKETGV